MKMLRQVEMVAGQREASIPREKRVESIEKIHLLSVGSLDPSFALHDDLLEGTCSHLSVPWDCLELWLLPDYRELWVFPRHEAPQVAILNDTLSSSELEEACRFIRLEWPSTRILVIRANEDFFDGALYDDRVASDSSSEVLLRAVDRLLQRWRE